MGHDHLGHGKSVTSKDKLGFFHESKGNTYVIGDIHHLRKITKKKYKDVHILCWDIVWDLFCFDSILDYMGMAFREHCDGNWKQVQSASYSRQSAMSYYCFWKRLGIPQ